MSIVMSTQCCRHSIVIFTVANPVRHPLNNMHYLQGFVWWQYDSFCCKTNDAGGHLSDALRLERVNIFTIFNFKMHCTLTHGVVYFHLHICCPTRANEALWGRYQNWHFKFNILFNILETFWHQNNVHIIFLSKVIDNLISYWLIHLKINNQDMGRQSYWYVHKAIEDITNNWIKT